MRERPILRGVSAPQPRTLLRPSVQRKTALTRDVRQGGYCWLTRGQSRFNPSRRAFVIFVIGTGRSGCGPSPNNISAMFGMLS